MKLVQEFTFNAALKQPLPVGAGPIGTRMYYDVTGGEVIATGYAGSYLEAASGRSLGEVHSAMAKGVV